VNSTRALLLAAAVLGFVAFPGRADVPPYAIQATPNGGGAEGAAVRFKPVRSGSEAITDQVCKLEIWADPAGHGATFIGGPDPTCSREETVTLPAGRYKVKLGVGWRSGGASRFATAEIPYEIRAVLPPFKVAVTPPLSSPEGTAVKIRPVVTAGAAISQQVCKLEVFPDAQGGHVAPSAVFTGPSDPGCSREETVRLPSGRYVVRLGAGWQPAGGAPSRFTTIETPYEVTAADKVQMTKCAFSTSQPMAGRPLNVAWEVRNNSAYPIGSFRVSVHVDQQEISGGLFVATLAPGAVASGTVAFTPPAAGTFRTRCSADPENKFHEPSEHFKNNTMNGEINVNPADILRPVVLLGRLFLGPLEWHQEYVVCNVDPDAFYDSKITGCLGCTGAWVGVPSKDFTPGSGFFSPDGSGVTPRCPAGLTSNAAFNPGTADGVRNQYEDRTYSLNVTASKDGKSAGVSVPVRVPQNCGMISIPICVPMEGKGR
jgi:hypothetical protein